MRELGEPRHAVQDAPRQKRKIAPQTENQSSSFLSRNTLFVLSTCSSQAAVRRAQLWGPAAQLPKPNGERAMAVEALLLRSTAPNDGTKSNHHATAADAPSSVIAVEWNQAGG